MTPLPSSLTHTSVNLPSILSLPIDVQNIGFYYHPDTPILREITFHINPGECVLVIGENGSGKSTYLSMLS